MNQKPEALRLADEIDEIHEISFADWEKVSAAAVYLRRLHAEVNRLRAVIDSRPAINSGLPATYIEWSQGIYEMDMAHAMGVCQ